MGDLYFNFLGQALGHNVNLPNTEGGGSPPSGNPPSDDPPSNLSPALPKLEERISQAIRTARGAYKSHQKQRSAADKDFIRSSLAAACDSAIKVIDSWPTVALPDAASLSLEDWPGYDPTKDTPPPPDSTIGAAQGVVRPAPPAHVSLHPKTATTNIAGCPIETPIWILPSQPTVPPYKSWTGVQRNQLSLDTGLRMFYTEAETGETIPLSDDEGATMEQVREHFVYCIMVLIL